MSRITQETAVKLNELFSNAGIPLHVWLPIMHLESSGNPRAHNPRGEDSRGLFQINLRSAPENIRALGERLFDPIVNATAILTGNDWLGNARRIRHMNTLPREQQAAYMWKYGIRPRWSTQHATRINYYSNEGLQSLINLYFRGKNPEGGDEGGGDSGSAILPIEKTPTPQPQPEPEERDEGLFGIRGFLEDTRERIVGMYHRILIMTFGVLALAGCVFLLFKDALVNTILPGGDKIMDIMENVKRQGRVKEDA